MRGGRNRRANDAIRYAIYKRPEQVNTRAIREKLTLIEEGLKDIVGRINKALDNFDNKKYIVGTVSDIISIDQQLLFQYKWLEKLALIKMLKILQYKTNVPLDRVKELKDSPAAHKIIEEIKGPDILGRLYVIRDGLKFMPKYLNSVPRYLSNDFYVDTVRIMLIDVENGVNLMLEQLNELKGLLEELAGYDAKLDHTEQQEEQHHSTTGNQHQLFLHL